MMGVKGLRPLAPFAPRHVCHNSQVAPVLGGTHASMGTGGMSWWQARPQRLHRVASETLSRRSQSDVARASQKPADQPGRSSKWGVPGGKKARRRAKDSVDGGAIRVDADDAAEWEAIRAELKAKATSLGLGPTAITSSDPSQRLAQYEEWIAQGFHGEMGFLARQDRLARRRDLAEILPDVRAVVVTSLPYWPGQRGFPPEQTEASRGSVSCYAWGDDYHEILGDKMRSLATWLHTRAGGAGRWYVDTGAVMERDLGERAGLGFIGKHSLLISPKIGSGFFLGEVLTTLPMPPDTPTSSRAGCGKCTKCLTACPTNAFAGPYVLDARRCISYLTIELKGSIPLELRPMMGNRIYGCDVCQQVCPWNSPAYKGRDNRASPLFGPVSLPVAAPELRELLQMDEDAFQRRFEGSAVHRIGLRRLVRNAAVAAGNSCDAALVPVVRKALEIWGDDELVAEHLQWALSRLVGSQGGVTAA